MNSFTALGTYFSDCALGGSDQWRRPEKAGMWTSGGPSDRPSSATLPPPPKKKPKSSRSAEGKQFFYGPSRSFHGRVLKPSWGERQLREAQRGIGQSRDACPGAGGGTSSTSRPSCRRTRIPPARSSSRFRVLGTPSQPFHYHPRGPGGPLASAELRTRGQPRSCRYYSGAGDARQRIAAR